MSASSPPGRPFWKWHGLGNHFVLVEGSVDQPHTLAQTLCRPRFGAGADGLLILTRDGADALRMRMFNPDGTEDDCGNGLRCAAAHAVRCGLVRRRSFRVETLSGPKEVEVLDLSGTRAIVDAGMGRARTRPEDAPVLVNGPEGPEIDLQVLGEPVRLTVLNTGSTHTVLFEQPDDARFHQLSPALEGHPAFPERTSVIWAVVHDRSRLSLRIWERGVGETLACGTGAAAAAVAAHLSGRVDVEVEVRSPGGALTIRIGPGLELRQRGPAELVYEGRYVGQPV